MLVILPYLFGHCPIPLLSPLSSTTTAFQIAFNIFCYYHAVPYLFLLPACVHQEPTCPLPYPHLAGTTEPYLPSEPLFPNTYGLDSLPLLFV